MIGGIISGLIGAGASLLGGKMNADAAERANEAQARQAELNRQMQLDFAQQGIRWKVADAEKAGIHPLYALGANTVSYSPVSVGSVADTSMGSAVASAGQDISRALDATRTSDERTTAVARSAAALQLERAGLENEVLRTQLAKMRGQLGPPLPALSDTNAIEGQPATRTVSLPAGVALATPGNESTQDAISKEYGDEGLPQLPGQYRFVRDLITRENAVRAGAYVMRPAVRIGHDLVRYWYGPSRYERRSRHRFATPTERR